MSRKYTFTLPHHFSSFEVQFAPERLKELGIWDDLPENFQNLITDAVNDHNSLDLTKEDLDEIDDTTWDKISQLFT